MPKQFKIETEADEKLFEQMMRICAEYFPAIETFEDDDYKEVHTPSVIAALAAAYEAGRKAGREEK